MRRLKASSHALAGGELHDTPEHGSPLHTPLVQPNEQGVSVGAYEQVPAPSLHVPTEA
jgi:hypothetical protein